MARKVKEPVQVYLDRSDRDLLETLSRQTGLSRAEVLRRGLRQYGAQRLTGSAPGFALENLIGTMGDDPSVPRDLAARHDEYLYGVLDPSRRRDRKRAD